MEILDGKKISLEIQEEIAIEVKKIIAEGYKKPHLAAILVGNDGASETYVTHKVKACDRCGFESTLIRFDETISESHLLTEIEKLNNDDDIDGFIVQLPLPKHIDEQKVTQAIIPSKDVDGFNPTNFGRMSQNLPAYIPATPFGIIQILERYKIDTAGKHCVVLGRSNIVGMPISILLARKSNPGNCTVTICHSRTKNISEEVKRADIIIAAIGIAEFVTKDMVKEGAIVIDVGITRVKDDSKKRGYSLKGDVNYSEVAEKASFITPVPGGVGPMTVTSLLINTLLATKGTIYPK